VLVERNQCTARLALQTGNQSVAQSWPAAQQIAGRLPVTILVPLMDRRVGRRYWAEKVKSRTRNRGGADLRDDAHILASRGEDRWTRN
jgi:hypothetical protein